MTPEVTDLFRHVANRGTTTTLAGDGYNSGDTSVQLASPANWITDTGIYFAMYRVDSDGLEAEGSYTVWNGVLGGSTVTGLECVYGDPEQSYAPGGSTVVVMHISSAWANALINGILQQHKQDGSHKNITSDAATIGELTVQTLHVGNQQPAADWTTTGTIPGSITPLGNHSYQVILPGNFTGALQPGTRIQSTRAVAAPTKSSLLNGSSQYWIKASPNKMTFTDDFVASAWIKLSSYSVSDQVIVSRYNGTNGWAFKIDVSGKIILAGYNGSGNSSYVRSIQSIPLNRWVHVSAQLDMSSFTTTATTSYIMVDGVDVPCEVIRTGTNPTALVQAGDLIIGARNSTALEQYFPGAIAQVAIFNTKVTQATMQGYISQGLLGTETSLASAYSLSGVATDLNTTTPNDLTAAGSAATTNADSPFGGQANGSISSTLDYGIVHAISYSSPNTTLIVQTPEGCTLPTSSGGVVSIAYSSAKSPFGFPSQSSKWKIMMIMLADLITPSPVSGTWYNAARISVPIGQWSIGYNVTALDITSAAQTAARVITTISASSSSETDQTLTRIAGINSASASLFLAAVATAESDYYVASITNYYLNYRTNVTGGATLGISNSGYPGIVYAKNGLL